MIGAHEEKVATAAASILAAIYEIGKVVPHSTVLKGIEATEASKTHVLACLQMMEVLGVIQVGNGVVRFTELGESLMERNGWSMHGLIRRRYLRYMFGQSDHPAANAGLN